MWKIFDEEKHSDRFKIIQEGLRFWGSLRKRDEPEFFKTEFNGFEASAILLAMR